jgi:hypothetical protein
VAGKPIVKVGQTFVSKLGTGLSFRVIETGGGVSTILVQRKVKGEVVEREVEVSDDRFAGFASSYELQRNSSKV